MAIGAAGTTSALARGVTGRAFLPCFFSARACALMATLRMAEGLLPSLTAAAAAAMACSPSSSASSTRTLKPLAGSNLGTVTPATDRLASVLAR